MKPSLLQSLFNDEKPRPLSVSEVNEQVKTTLERNFSSVWIEAEIVNFVAAGSGHWYFTLHDGFSQLRAACYARNNTRIRFQPFDGLQVRVRGKLSLYQPRGEYQILVESLEPIGEGALKVAFEQVKAKLSREGLFDEDLKRELPFFPKRVGVVTSPNGAAFHDILNVISRRTRTVHLVLIPTRVQGETAGEEVTAAINLANQFNLEAEDEKKIDVLIVGRGGGSAEDLWAFNEERVARAIRNSLIPVISAVGHEIDFTIADLVADRRAPTPSAAAEIVAEAEDQIEAYIESRTRDLFQILNYRMLTARAEFQELALSPVFKEIPRRITDWHYELEDARKTLREAVLESLKRDVRKLDEATGRMSPLKLASKLGENSKRLAVLTQRQLSAAKNNLNAKDEALKIKMASLNALSPLAVLQRGFSITENTRGEILRDAAQVKSGEEVKILLNNGKLKAKIIESEETAAREK